jgi:hypothetical protein
MKNVVLTPSSQKIAFAPARKKYYAVVSLPDGQRIRFDLDSIISKMSETEIEAAVKSIAYVQDDLTRTFEDSRFPHLPKPTDDQVRRTKETALEFEGLGHICQAAANAIEIQIYENGLVESDGHLMSSGLVKNLLKQNEERTERGQREDELS